MHCVRYLLENNLRRDRTSPLLEYLLHAGADEFSVRVMALQETLAPFADAFEDELGPFERPIALRPAPETSRSTAPVRPVRVWSLTARSLHHLLSFLDDGVFQTPAGPDGWLEDLTVYRNGALVFGVVSHEREAVLSLTPNVHDAIARLDISSIASSQWLGATSFTPSP